MARRRLDLEMVRRGLSDSREMAQLLIKSGKVLVSGSSALKPSSMVDASQPLKIIDPLPKYVSRAGGKLEAALETFKVELKSSRCIDVGASTGGFTDVLLKRGAAIIYAVDVGHSQIAETIKKNPKVCNLEKTNARHLNENIIGTPPSIIVCDVSFISLQLALPPALALASPKADLLALIKPQFEVGKAFIGKGGVVRDENARNMAENSICCFLQEQGWHIRGTCPSPIEGPDGNCETMVAAFR